MDMPKHLMQTVERTAQIEMRSSSKLAVKSYNNVGKYGAADFLLCYRIRVGGEKADLKILIAHV